MGSSGAEKTIVVVGGGSHALAVANALNEKGKYAHNEFSDQEFTLRVGLELSGALSVR